jgi:large subunit ribosomal protein L17
MLQVISLGKDQKLTAYQKASAFVLDQTVLPKLFGLFARRYAERPGGYTRIHKIGNRKGDNAPAAILELVDNPRDIRLEITARAVGWELLKENLLSGDVSEILEKGVGGAQELIEEELEIDRKEVGRLRSATRWNLQKILRYRNPSLIVDIGKKAQDHAVCSLLACFCLPTLMSIPRIFCWRNLS